MARVVLFKLLQVLLTAAALAPAAQADPDQEVLTAGAAVETVAEAVVEIMVAAAEIAAEAAVEIMVAVAVETEVEETNKILILKD